MASCSAHRKKSQTDRECFTFFVSRKFKNVIKRSENTEYVRPCVASETNFSSKKETSSSFKHYVVALLSTMASHFEVLDINYTVEKPITRDRI